MKAPHAAFPAAEMGIFVSTRLQPPLLADGNTEILNQEGPVHVREINILARAIVDVLGLGLSHGLLELGRIIAVAGNGIAPQMDSGASAQIIRPGSSRHDSFPNGPPQTPYRRDPS